MEDFNQKATKEIADMMHYVAEDAVKNAPYDKTRNARVTKVYKEGYVFDEYISGYDVDVDGRSYHITKERGKGVIAKVDDIVKLHFPCDNSNLMYISYSHDPEDYIAEYTPTHYGYVCKYNNGNKVVKIFSNTYQTPLTFPATTNQFSETTITIDCEEAGISVISDENKKYAYAVMCDNSVWGTVDNDSSSDWIIVHLFNKNPNTTNSVTKNVNVRIVAERQL